MNIGAHSMKQFWNCKGDAALYANIRQCLPWSPPQGLCRGGRLPRPTHLSFVRRGRGCFAASPPSTTSLGKGMGCPNPIPLTGEGWGEGEGVPSRRTVGFLRQHSGRPENGWLLEQGDGVDVDGPPRPEGHLLQQRPRFPGSHQHLPPVLSLEPRNEARHRAQYIGARQAQAVGLDAQLLGNLLRLGLGLLGVELGRGSAWLAGRMAGIRIGRGSRPPGGSRRGNHARRRP